MKNLLALVSLAALCACASFTGVPDAAQVIAIQNACAIDAGIRPTVSLLMVLATPAEALAVTDARAIIDPICANPTGSVQANTLAALSGASAQIVGVLTTLEARKAAPKPV